MQHEKDSFSFKKAVREACRDFPLETRQVTFVEASTPDAQSKFTQALKRMSPQTQQHMRKYTGSLNSAFELTRTLKGDSVLSDAISGRKILFVDPSEKSRAHLFRAQFAFDHELGHIVTRNGITPTAVIEQKMAENPNECLSILARTECAADTFAALRGLQRSSMTLADVEQLSLDRARSTIDMNFVHITTPALDALLAHPDINRLIRLSPHEMATFAADHAEKHAPSAKDIQYIRLHFGIEPNEKQPSPADKRSNFDRAAASLINDIAHMSSAGDNGCTPAFHIAARVMRHVFDTNGLDYPAQIDHKFDSKYWQFIEKRLTENAKEMGRLRPLLTPKNRGFAA